MRYQLTDMHPLFQLNGVSYTNEALRSYGDLLVYEGEVYQQEIGYFLLEWLSPKDFIVVETSGSTGVPKKLKLKKSFMINSALATGSFFEVYQGTKALLCLSAKYIGGKMMLVRAMVLGWNLDIVNPTSSPLDAVKSQYDFCAMVPLQLANSLARLNKLNKLIVGGGVVSPALIKRLEQLPTKIYETYGMTETISHIAARRLNSSKKDIAKSDFTVLPNVLLGTDERGCLIIDAPKLAADPIVTNDVVLLKSAKFFCWLGRYDNVVNSGGIKLYPEAIELKLAPLIAARFFLTGIPDPLYGEKLIALVEQLRDDPAFETLHKRISELPDLQPYERPKTIYFLNKFSETPSGKVQRIKTRALISDF